MSRVQPPEPGNSRDVVDVHPELRPGDVVSERYRLERRLGSGATAAVWCARDRELGRAVALKLLRGDDVVPELAARFEREATILGRLSHPNVVPVVATGKHRGRPYLVMELVEGEPLTDVLRRGPMPIERAVDLVAAVAAGLGAAHRAGVVHRDVKPANIVRSDDGMPRLIDFGIARADDLTNITSTNVVVGTAAYLSPEQARGDAVGPASDVYSLGCVLYEALTGRPPFDADSAIAVVYRHVHDPPSPPSEVRPELTTAIDAVVMRCLAKAPQDRYATGTELEAALRRAVSSDGEDTDTVAIAPVRDATMVMPAVGAAAGDELIDASPLAPFEARKRPWGVIAAAAAAVLVLLAIAASLGGGDDPSGRATTESSVTSTTSPTSIVTTAPETTLEPDIEVRIGKGNGKGKGQGR